MSGSEIKLEVIVTDNYVVTGVSRGIGLEMTKQLLEAGHNVYALARKPTNSPLLMKLKEQKPEKLHLFSVDVTQENQVQNFLKELSSLEHIDVLINNAGVYGSGNLEGASMESVLQTIATNSIAPMRMSRALLPWLKKSRRPRVIHITSLMGSIADNESGGHYDYRMSKAALNMFHKSFSVDYPSIVSIAMHPGWVKTDMGGKDAPTEPQDSARGILKIAEQATSKDTGKFLDFEGDELPW